MFPLLGLIFIYAKPFVNILFGDQWTPLIPLIKIFTILGAIESLDKFSGALFLSQGKVKILATINILRGLASILAFYIGAQYNISFVAWGIVVVFLLFFVPRLYYGGKSIDCNLNEIFKNYINLKSFCNIFINFN